MNYDYNGNLTFEERVAVITKELISYGLDKEMALKVASIEEPITTKDIYDFTFKRLSNILMLSDNKRINDKVIKDMFNIYEEGKNNKVDTYISELKDYLEYNTSLPIYK